MVLGHFNDLICKRLVPIIDLNKPSKMKTHNDMLQTTHEYTNGGKVKISIGLTDKLPFSFK